MMINFKFNSLPPNFLRSQVLNNILFNLVLLLVLMGFSLVGFGQDEILLYENDFENFNIEPSNTWCYLDTDNAFVNDLWGGTGNGISGNILFTQIFTVETMLINGEDNVYTDPFNLGGNYCIGMQSTGQDDMLSLTLDSKGLTFLNISFSLSAIDLDGCGSAGVDTPIMKISIYDSPEGVLNFSNPGNSIGETTLTGIEPNIDKYTFNWTEVNSNVNITESTNGNISIVFDLTQSGYAAFDNLRITATETCDSTGSNLENGLLAHYPFEGNSTDVSSNTNNGELFGATLTTDRFGNEGNAFNFDGNSHISIADHPTLRPQNFTISLWCRFDDLSESVKVLIDKHLIDDNDTDSYELWFSDNQINGCLSDEDGASQHIRGDLEPNLNDWYHIIYSFSDNNNIKSLYINNSLVNSLEEIKTIDYTNTPVNIGASYLSETELQYYFIGDIDDVRIYDRVLSSCEIEALFAMPYVSYIETDCADGIDNDGDGFLDCEDLDCVTNNLCLSNSNTACPADSVFKLRPGDGVFTCASEREDTNPVVSIKNLDEVLPNHSDTKNSDLSGLINSGKVFRKQEIGGEVFGTCIDDAGNIYLAATTLYSYDARNFNGLRQNGFASIVKINGDSLAIDTTFLAVLRQSAHISGFINETGEAFYKSSPRETYSGLGNIAYDKNRDHLLVTNFEDGKIWRIKTNGIVIDGFDPFIPDDGIDGFAPLGERLWGIQTYALDDGSTEVYFGVWSMDRRASSTNRNTLYKMKIDAQGSFVNNSLQFVLEVPDLRNSNQPISDIAISKDGLRLILSCHTMFGDINLDPGATPDFAHYSSLYYIERNNLDNYSWSSPKRFNLSRNTSIGNSAGGVDFGPKQAVPDFDFGSICDQMVWASGDNLLNGVTTYGLQGFSISEIFNENAVNINESYIIDGNGISGNDKSYLGDIEIFKCDCFECDVSLNIESSIDGNNCCFVADLRNLGVSTNATKIELSINDGGFQFDTLVTISSNFIFSIDNETLFLEANPANESYPLLPNLNSNNFLNFCIINNEVALENYTFTVKYFDPENKELRLCQQSLQVETETCVVSPSSLGCTSPTACNYNPAATQDDGSCVSNRPECDNPCDYISGCTNPESCNFNINATCDDGSCYQTSFCFFNCQNQLIPNQLPGSLCQGDPNVVLSYRDQNCDCFDLFIDVGLNCILEPAGGQVIGDEYCFQITVVDTLNNNMPIPNTPVNFAVGGANEGLYDFGFSDENGIVKLCYTPTNPGQDFITITSGNFTFTFINIIWDFSGGIGTYLNFNYDLNFNHIYNGMSSPQPPESLIVNDSLCTTITIMDEDSINILAGVQVSIISTIDGVEQVLVDTVFTTNIYGQIEFCPSSPYVGIEECIITTPFTSDTLQYVWQPIEVPCQNQPGQMQTANSFVCDGAVVYVREAFSTIDENSVRVYVLHEEEEFDGINYIDKSESGRFTSPGTAYTNRPLYISAVIGPPDENGLPKLNDECTEWSPYGAEYTFFDPINIKIIEERCEDGLYFIDVSLTGGVGGISNNFAYRSIFDGITLYQNVAKNEVVTFGPYQGTGNYNIFAIGGKGCPGEVSGSFNCGEQYRSAAITQNGLETYNIVYPNADLLIEAAQIFNTNGQCMPSNIQIDNNSCKVELTNMPHDIYLVQLLITNKVSGKTYITSEKIFKN